MTQGSQRLARINPFRQKPEQRSQGGVKFPTGGRRGLQTQATQARERLT